MEVGEGSRHWFRGSGQGGEDSGVKLNQMA